MSMLAKWKLGAKAYALMCAAGEFVSRIDFEVVLAVAGKVIAIEADPRYAGRGHGLAKADALVDWYIKTYPDARYIAALEQLSGFADAFVAVMNVVRVFKA